MKKRVLILCVLVVLVAVGAGLVWFHSNYLIVSNEVYSRSDTVVKLSGSQLPDFEKLTCMEQLLSLDLREIPITVEEYAHVQELFPDCQILWRVELLKGHYDNTVTELSVSDLELHDLEQIRYLTMLERIDAAACTDYELLQLLESRYPHIQVDYTIKSGDLELERDAVRCAIDNDNAEALFANIPYLPKLQSIDASACSNYPLLKQIKDAYPAIALEYTVPIGGTYYPPDTEELTLFDADGAEVLEMLPLLPMLTNVTFTGTAPDNELIYQMKSQYPQITFRWDFEVLGAKTSSMVTELDLSGISMENTDAVEDALKYFYNLERVIMCDCGISSEDMDALGKRHPQIRFVWTIQVGRGTLRTDAVGFIPFHMGHNQHLPLYDEDVKDLKYCVDLLCLDLGHMKVRDVSFIQYMPKLKYLILVDMEVEDFSYIADLKDLIFLELFQTNFTDVRLLMGLKNLEDLNIAWTDLDDPDLLKEMTWLKRLWATKIGYTREEALELIKALPDTLVYVSSEHPTHGGWRQSKNYYEMRDLLNMFYLE